MTLINVGMWFGMKTGTRPRAAVTNVKCYCEKEAELPTCPAALCQQFFFWLKIFLKFREGQSQKPERQDLPNSISNLSVIDNAP